MRYFLLLLLTIFIGISCNNSPDRPEPAVDQATIDANQASTPVTTTPVTSTPGETVPHYICPNNCAGSGGSVQGNCPVCGTAYTHNQAFHNQPSSNPVTTPGETPPVNLNTNPSPAQNAQGVYHYICSNGCEGGAASQGSCANCGGALTHNAEYHNG